MTHCAFGHTDWVFEKPSEPTIQAMLTIKLHLSGVVAGESDAHDVSKYASDRHELFKNLKTHFRKNQCCEWSDAFGVGQCASL